MADRSIVLRLRADISSLRSQMTAAQQSIKGVADTAAQTSAKSWTALSGIGPGLSKGLDSIDKHRQSLHTLGSGFTVLGVAAAAGVGVAVKSFADFDETMSHVAATGKDAQANLGFLRQAALQAGADTKYSASEAAAGVESLLKAGVSAQDVLGGGLSGALNLAASGNLNVADSAEAAASAMTQFGLKGSDVPHIADLLAAGAGKAQGEVSDMAAALNQTGLVASQFGLSIEDTVGSLSAFAAAGLTGSDAGTSFKTMLQRLANPSAEASALMKSLKIDVYDANGSFVGMSKFAQELQDKLGGLTDAQRNADLAIIGGADAVRPLSVLYKDGAAGISDWIAQVNDAGYAAQTAGRQMDNLKGDFEQLKGSIDTDLIQSGSGLNDFLREVTQGATGAANSFGRLSPEAQHSAVQTAAIAGGAALGVAGLIKLATSAASTKTALTELNLIGDQSSGKLGKLGKAAGSLALVVGVAEAVGAGFDKVLRRNDPTLDDAGAALVAFGKGGVQAGAGMDQFFTTLHGTNDIDPFTKQVTTLGGAIDYVFNQTDKQKADNFISGWLPGSDQLEVVNQRFADLDSQLVKLASTGAAPQAAAGFKELAEQFQAHNVSAEQMLELFPRYEGALKESANALGVTTLSAQDYADWMGGKVPAAITKAAAANPKVAATLTNVGGAADDATQELQSYADALLAITSASSSAEDAIDSARSSIKGSSHDLNTSRGRSNQAALDNVGSKSRDAVSDLQTGGASQQAIDAAAAHYRKKYREIAESIGYSSKAARALADDIIAIPTAKDVRIVTPGAKVSADQAATLNHEIQKLPKEQQARIVTIAETKGAKAARNAIAEVKDKQVIARALGDLRGPKAVKKAMNDLHDRLVAAKTRGDTSGARDVQRAINALHDKTIHLTTVKVDRKGSGVSVDNGRRAGGGAIWGPGTGTSDEVPILASNGEYMQTAAAHAYYGTQGMDAIRAMRVPRDAIAGYRAGGPVGELPGYAKGGSVDNSVVRLVGLARNVDEARNLSELIKALRAQEKATKKLSETQTTATEAVKQLSSSLKDPYRSTSGDVGDVLAQLQQGASDLTAFGAQLTKLKDAGLSQGVINQITADGAVKGGDLAAGILAGGASMVQQLNRANAALDKAASNLALTASGVKRKKAYGGPVWGGSGTREDDVDVSASGGEFMVQEPIARTNMGFLQAFNAGRRVVPSYAAAQIPAGQSFAPSHVDRSYREGDVNLTGVIGDPDVWLRKVNNRKRDRRAMAGLAVR